MLKPAHKRKACQTTSLAKSRSLTGRQRAVKHFL